MLPAAKTRNYALALRTGQSVMVHDNLDTAEALGSILAIVDNANAYRIHNRKSSDWEGSTN